MAPCLEFQPITNPGKTTAYLLYVMSYRDPKSWADTRPENQISWFGYYEKIIYCYINTVAPFNPLISFEINSDFTISLKNGNFTARLSRICPICCPSIAIFGAPGVQDSDSAHA